jgi:hypothetical protein
MATQSVAKVSNHAIVGGQPQISGHLLSSPIICSGNIYNEHFNQH